MHKAPTLTEPVFVSKYSGLTVTRFNEERATKDNPGRPGLRYQFGAEVAGITDSQGLGIIAGGSLRVDAELRRRDEMYIEEWGELLHSEKPLNREQRRLRREGDLPDEDQFYTTDEFLRNKTKEPGCLFNELPAVAPDASEVLARVQELGIAHDAEGLLEIGEEEKGEWNRPQVIEAVQRAVAQIAAGEGPDEAA